MKAETLTVKACEVKKGDVTPWGKAMSDAYLIYDSCFAFRGEDAVHMPMNQATPFRISRPVADPPCPRGRMDIENGGLFTINGKLVATMSQETIAAYQCEMVRRWNAIEDRTTAEIEAGEKGQ